MADNTIEFECGKCKQKMRVHNPVLLRLDNGAITQVTLIPSWNAEERVCRNCGAINAPRLVEQVQYGWVAYEPQRAGRIVEPSGQEVADISKHKRAVG